VDWLIDWLFDWSCNWPYGQPPSPPSKLEYRAVYGRSCMGESTESWLLEYYRYASRWAAINNGTMMDYCLSHLWRSGSLKSALNTWSKVWPWILLWAYLICNFASIFGQQISILEPPYIGLFGQSSWSELSPWCNCGGSIGPWTYFCHGQKRDYLSRASQRARGATKN